MIVLYSTLHTGTTKVFVTFLESSMMEVQASEHLLVHCVELGHFSITQSKILSKF